MAVLGYHTYIKKITIISRICFLLYLATNVDKSVRFVVLWTKKVLNNKLNEDFTKQLLSTPYNVLMCKKLYYTLLYIRFETCSMLLTD